MQTDITQQEVASALRQVRTRAAHPRALTILPEDRSALEGAVDRAESQLLGEAETVLTMALVGCSGAGKSTLINALAGKPIARIAAERPCTERIQVYHHQDVPRGGLPPDLARAANFVTHARPELRHKLLVDTPDLDSFETHHRAAARALLKHAGLVLYICTPERYLEERAWSILREERQFSRVVTVLNYSPALTTPATVESITADLRAKLAEAGVPDAPVFRLCAVCHTPDHEGHVHALPPDAIDEFQALRSFIEHEITAGDVARMVHQQRQRVVDHLAATLDRIVPPTLLEPLSEIEDVAQEQGDEAGRSLAFQLENRLASIEDDLMPMAARRRARLFWGPLRTSLGTTEFLRYHLPRMMRLHALQDAEEGTRVQIEKRLVTGMDTQATYLLRSASGTLQHHYYDAELPVGHWQEITTAPSGSSLLRTVADEVRARLEAHTADRLIRRRVAFVLSALATLVLVSFTIFGLVRTVQGLLTFDINVAYGALGLTVIGVVLSLLMLHGLAVLLVPIRRHFGASTEATDAVADVVQQTVVDWARRYRRDLEADAADLRQPLRLLRAAVEEPLRLPAPTPPALEGPSTQAVQRPESTPDAPAPSDNGAQDAADPPALEEPADEPVEEPVEVPVEQPERASDDLLDNPFLAGAQAAQRRMKGTAE